MNLYILYTKDTPADRDISYLQRRLDERRISWKAIDADSRDGAAKTELYDIMRRPAVLVTDSSGGVMQKWEGELPRLEDIITYYPAG
ncbi:MAG TPA: hypothetical protein VF272_01715 [Candidatus Saccharimonadia bacterium]